MKYIIANWDLLQFINDYCFSCSIKQWRVVLLPSLWDVPGYSAIIAVIVSLEPL